MNDPKPGTREAWKAGCVCPLMDNAYGKGYFGDGEKYGWVVTGGCPVHAPEDQAN